MTEHCEILRNLFIFLDILLYNGIILYKPVFVFLQDNMGGGWFRYMPVVGFESLRGEIPKLTENFAGIGTREIKDNGIEAIKKVFETNFGVVA